MVDARLPAEWLGDLRFDALSDRAFRVLAGALMWCNAHGTDGLVPERYTRYLHPDGADSPAFDELTAAGLWRSTTEGFQLIDWAGELHQSTAAEIERYKDSARRRQRAYRDRQRVPPAAATQDRVTRDVTRDTTRSVGSGSLTEMNDESAYGTGQTTGDVTRDDPPSVPMSPFCSAHPSGTVEPCGACARTRVAFNLRPIAPRPAPWDCGRDGHKYVADGSCAVCEIPPSRDVHGQGSAPTPAFQSDFANPLARVTI